MASTASHLFDIFARLNVQFSHGKGVWLYTKEGEAFLDFTSGVAVNSFGHTHPVLVEALTQQAKKVWHLSNLLPIEGQESLAKLLCNHSFAEKVLFLNSGAEAVETAIKTMRRYFYSLGQPQKHKILTFEGAFHGRTLGALAATAQPKYMVGFDPVAAGFQQIPFGDLGAVEQAIDDQTGGILIEPIQAEAGVRTADKRFMQGLRQLCNKYGLLLILDEVQTGIGRSGKLFAYEWSDIEPDILCSAKALGGGFPVGACLTTEKIAKAMDIGSHGSTFGGNPLAMAVAETVLNLLLAPGFLQHVNKISEQLKEQLLLLIDRYPTILKSYHGKGLLIGLECQIPNIDILDAALQQNLLVSLAGRNMLRLLPPLILSEEEASEGVNRLEKALQSL